MKNPKNNNENYYYEAKLQVKQILDKTNFILKFVDQTEKLNILRLTEIKEYLILMHLV